MIKRSTSFLFLVGLVSQGCGLPENAAARGSAVKRAVDAIEVRPSETRILVGQSTTVQISPRLGAQLVYTKPTIYSLLRALTIGKPSWVPALGWTVDVTGGGTESLDLVVVEAGGVVETSVVMVEDPAVMATEHCPYREEGCFGAIGSNCDGVGTRAPCTINTDGSQSCLVSRGSLEHDWCCHHNPSGYACAHGWGLFPARCMPWDTQICCAEWNDAVKDYLKATQFTHTYVDWRAGVSHCRGQNRGALLFDGIDDLVRIPHSASLSPGATLTIEAWVRLDGVPTSGCPVPGYGIVLQKWGDLAPWSDTRSYSLLAVAD